MQHVEAHAAHHAEIVEPFHHHAARLAQQRQQIDGGRLPPLLLARLDGGGRRGGVGDDVPLDAVEVRLLAAGDEARRLLPRHVAVEAFERGERTRGPLVAIEHVGTGADVFVDLLVGVGLRDPLRHDEADIGGGFAEAVREQRERLLQAEHEAAVVDGDEFVQRGLDALREAVALHPALDRCDAVRRAHRRAVVEF